MAGEPLEQIVGDTLRAQHLTLAVAESCTGGLLGHRITNVAGSSDYFLGGVISYSNAAKEQLLGVTATTLAAYGAVSQAAAQEMAQGVRRLLGAHIGLSVTGIAGPGGGTPDKPVGLVYIGLSAEGQELSRRFVWSGSREENKAASAQAALDLLAEYLACFTAETQRAQKSL